MPASAAHRDLRPTLLARAGRLVWLLLACLVASTTHALPLADPATAAARERFVAAERALRGGDLAQFRRLRDALADYPLQVYLLFDDVERRFDTVADADVAALVAAHAGAPRAERLRRRWLERSAARGDWRTFLSAWTPQRSDELECHHARALYATGAIDAAHAATTELWLSGRSRPDACDGPFRRLRDAGRLDAALVWQRAALAVAAGERTLARYLARSLPADDARLVDVWLDVRANPALVRDGRLFDRDTPHRREIRLDGLTRLARRDPGLAVDAWRTMEERHAWSDEQRVQALRALGLGFAQEHLPGGAEWLDAIPDAQADERVWEWRALTRLRARDWRGLLAALDRMPAAMRDDEAWRYWRARALERLGDTALADTLYRSLAGTRSFHGFLAADRLGADYDFTPDLLRFEDSELAATAAVPGIARARELLALDREVDARREWYAALATLDTPHILQAARLAQLWGWHTQAIFTVARADHFDDIELRFPVLYADEVGDNAGVQGLEPAWVLAVARQESAFMADARSPAGALGLMQIMPATGRSIARALDEPFRGEQTLLDPASSIRFGAHYLRRLLDRFGGHPALATAAYNAGASRAERWRPTDSDLEADIWIDTVPYAETRRYLQRVSYYTAIYQHRLGMPVERLSARLGPVPARRPQAALSVDSSEL